MRARLRARARVRRGMLPWPPGLYTSPFRITSRHESYLGRVRVRVWVGARAWVRFRVSVGFGQG